MKRRTASFLAATVAAVLAVGCDSGPSTSPPSPSAPAPQGTADTKAPATAKGKRRPKQEPGPDYKPGIPKRSPEL